MPTKFFNANDAYRNLSNLTPEQAAKWVRFANRSLTERLRNSGESGLGQARLFAQRAANAEILGRRPYEA